MIDKLKLKECVDIMTSALGKIASNTDDPSPPFRAMLASKMTEIAKEALSKIIQIHKENE